MASPETGGSWVEDVATSGLDAINSKDSGIERVGVGRGFGERIGRGWSALAVIDTLVTVGDGNALRSSVRDGLA